MTMVERSVSCWCDQRTARLRATGRLHDRQVAAVLCLIRARLHVSLIERSAVLRTCAARWPNVWCCALNITSGLRLRLGVAGDPLLIMKLVRTCARDVESYARKILRDGSNLGPSVCNDASYGDVSMDRPKLPCVVTTNTSVFPLQEHNPLGLHLLPVSSMEMHMARRLLQQRPSYQYFG